MAKGKKKKRSMEEVHRQVQTAVQALPYAIEDHRKHGRGFKAGMLRYVGGPMVRLMNRVLNATRYRGPEGQKTKQTEHMRRHLEQRQQAMKHVQGEIKKMQKRKPR